MKRSFNAPLGPQCDSFPDFLSYDERMKQIQRVLEYCWETGILLPKTTRDSHGFEYVVVPGGRYNQFVYEGRPPEYKGSPTLIASERTSMSEVLMPSFLFMKYPVSNRQFLKFVKEHPGYGKTLKSIQNQYYLADFPDEDIVGLDDPVWEQPVVRIDIDAAAHFASSYSLVLPHEAHYECAARVFWNDADFVDPESAKVFPWPNPTPTGYARFKNGKVTSKLIPWWINGQVDEHINQFVEWREGLGPRNSSHVIEGLIDGVLEWTQDRWSPEWPANSKLDWFEIEPNWLARINPDKYYTVRGGSYLEAGKNVSLAVRRPANGQWVNEDRGFRCVKIIIPSNNDTNNILPTS